MFVEKPRLYRSQMEMHHPDFEKHHGDKDSMSFGRIVPVYREIGGLYQKTLRRVLNGCVAKFVGFRSCTLPSKLCKEHDLLSPWRAIRDLHQPAAIPVDELRNPPEKTLAFEELFFYCLSLAIRKRQRVRGEGISFNIESSRYSKLVESLPFQLTQAQGKVLEQIREDMASAHPMNRLLQGDVGSGKTVVAVLAALIAIDNQYQAAFMAPTEILADQHFQTLSKWGEQVGITVRSLLGRHSKSEREEVLGALAAGKVDLLVGTHAVLEKGVKFKSLGFVVVDEQHRFGVRQRALLRTKGKEPDVLVMSATPIPRTLALTLYGDLDVSLLRELPKGRKPIDTRIFADKRREEVYETIRKEVGNGHQAFVVYPLVEESEHLDAKDATSMAEELSKKVFPKFRVGLVHGQMPSVEKEHHMSLFVKGEIDVLVSTTVIEVGIDVPNATVMVIEHPERFGLSQLHQLRGRVGRGTDHSSCLLIRQQGISNLAKERMDAFVQIHDGFLLAEEDLRLRGPGDFFGVAQSGFPYSEQPYSQGISTY